MTIAEFDIEVKNFLQYYHTQPHSKTKVSPMERWNGKGFLPQLPESLEKLDLLLLTVAKPRKIHQDGIHFQSLRYLDPILAAYVGESIIIRYDPRDMAEIRVFYKDKFLCRAICQELASTVISLKDITQARQKRKKELKEIINRRRSLVDQLLSSQLNSHKKNVKTEEINPNSIKKSGKLKLYVND